jgi:Holliday junction resolvasome RuvABC endonuclease subunit
VKVKKFGTSNLNGAVAIGIDQSFAGFAITAIDKDQNYYTEVRKIEGTGVERLSHARSFLIGFLDRYEVEAVAMEGYAFGREFGVAISGELGGMIRLALFDKYRSDNPKAAFPIIVPPTSLKKYVTNKGTGVKKNQMLLAIYKKWDVEFTSDDAADSYGLARIALNKHDFEYEKQVYDKLTDK